MIRRDEPTEGGFCPDYSIGCGGRLQLTQEPCYCSAINHPPCSHCTDSRLRCDACEKEF